MPTPLEKVRFAVDAGFNSLDRHPPHPVTEVPTMADTLLPLLVQQELVTLMGPIPRPPTSIGADMTTAAGYKVSVRFAGPDGITWTETYAVPGATPYLAATKMEALIPYRLAFLAVGYFVDYIRASDVTKLRSSITIAITGLGQLPVTISLGQHGACLEYQIFNGTGTSTLRTFRGLPRDQVQIHPTLGVATSPTCDPLVKAYIVKLAQAGVGYFPVEPVPKGGVAGQFSYNPIVSINGAAFPGSALVTVRNPYTLTSSGMVQLSLCDAKLYPGINGIWNAEPATDTTFYIPYQVANNSNLLHWTGRMRVYQLQAIRAFAEEPAPRFSDAQYRQTRSFDSRGRAGRRVPNIRLLA